MIETSQKAFQLSGLVHFTRLLKELTAATEKEMEEANSLVLRWATLATSITRLHGEPKCKTTDNIRKKDNSMKFHTQKWQTQKSN